MRVKFLILSTIALICIFTFTNNFTQKDVEIVSNGRTGNFKPIVEQISKEDITYTPNSSNLYYKTNYCSCYKCCGRTHGDRVVGAYGIELTPFVSVACNDFPCNTELLITHQDGTQEIWIVQDTGGMGSGVIDLYTGNDHNLALNIPNEWVTVQVLGEENG